MQFISNFIDTYSLSSYLIIVFISTLISFPLRILVGRILFKITLSTDYVIDDYLVDALRPFRFVFVIPVGVGFFLSDLAAPHTYIAKVTCGLLFIGCVIDTLSKLLNGLGEILRHNAGTTSSSYAGMIDIAKLIIFMIGIAVIIAIFFETSPLALISGIGAFTAVLMLVFKDTVLSIVASIQNATWDYFREGDWIESPDFGADGIIERIGLYGVKLRNWDYTTSLIPTHRILNVRTKNYRSMQEKRARQIARSIYIDMDSIHFCKKQMLESLKDLESISEEVERQLVIMDDVDSENTLMNKKTNLDLFRLYTEKYLHKHSGIHHKKHLVLVRDRAPSPEGMPMQIWAYTNKVDIVGYEAIQSNVFNHLVAIMHLFELKVFQRKVGGND